VRSIAIRHTESGYRYGQDHPGGYLITFRTYASWLHGDSRGSVDREHNIFGTAMLPADPVRQRREAHLAGESAVTLSPGERQVVHRAIEEVCVHHGWHVHAVNVRSNHVHVVVSGTEPPERMMNAFKARATLQLRRSGLRSDECHLWARHGSTPYLWTDEQLAAACNYVVDRQDEPHRDDD